METADFGNSLEGFPLAPPPKFTFKHILIQKSVLCTLRKVYIKYDVDFVIVIPYSFTFLGQLQEKDKRQQREK